MAADESPVQVRELEKIMSGFSYSNGLDVSRVFDDLLMYIIYYFTPDAKPLENWKYKKEQTAVFWQMFQEWIKIMNKETSLSDWYDAFGDLYMTCVAGKSRTQGSGQFFTPCEICDLMADFNGEGEKVVGKLISDPTCGSGRTLLSWHVRNLGNYLCGEDMDRTCCLMTVCNFIIHGCVGEVIWHNSLDPDSYYGGWKVNERLNAFGMPSVREIGREESKVWQVWESRRLEYKSQDEEIITVKPEIITPIEEISTKKRKNMPGKALQLNLFD
ncbi:N-6 DNA methylase [Bacteroides ihuae]|uniref:N-6 DNA methylase n=1 Tax=Bacteroides ihuae TaxID=1852362 RepID=UPI0008DA2912|nr:N-6 DNA methylase [Bacteroides ihuae]